MSCTVKDIMHPRVSLPADEKGDEILKKLAGIYPALPVVNDKREVLGIVSEYDILGALEEGRTIHEFSAESVMSCGHAEHGSCKIPVTVKRETSLKEIVDIMFKEHLSILPVVDGKQLIGIISRKNIINALAEDGFWPEHEFQKRVKAEH